MQKKIEPNIKKKKKKEIRGKNRLAVTTNVFQTVMLCRGWVKAQVRNILVFLVALVPMSAHKKPNPFNKTQHNTSRCLNKPTSQHVPQEKPRGNEDPQI